MTAREFTSHAEVDAARLGVLGALSRGMGLSYAARADGISVAQAQEIADAAGWPDLDAVRATWEDLKAALRHQHLPAGAIPLERITPAQAEQEYRGTVVQTGPTPEHLEPLADYVARVTETYDCVTGDCGCQPEAMRSCPGRSADALTEREEDERAYSDAVRATSETVQDVEQRELDAWAEENAELIASEEVELIPVEQPLDHYHRPPTVPHPPAVKRSATRPGTLPCEGCGRGVTREYVAATGIQRHGHCREGA